MFMSRGMDVCTCQDVDFQKAMGNMHVLYSHDRSWTLRIQTLSPHLHDPSPSPELSNTLVRVYNASEARVADVPIARLILNGVAYELRGWCLAEMLWSLAREAAWKSICIPLQEGMVCRAPMEPAEFQARASAKDKEDDLVFTHRSDLGPVVRLQEKVFREKSAEATVLALGYLPAAQVEILSRALPHYHNLEILQVFDSEVNGAAGQARREGESWFNWFSFGKVHN